jgi:hypothetical protein
MTIPSNSWLSMDTSREALFDELVKIGEAEEKKAPKKKGLGNALRTAGAGAAGTAVGMAGGQGAVYAVNKGFPGSSVPRKSQHKLPKGSFKRKVLTIGLPIGAGLGATLWDRARQKTKRNLGEQ